MQLTDWLVVILLVAILVVLLDGVRRRLAERRNRVVLKLDRNLPPADGSDEEIITSAELPNGGARTLPRQDRPAPTLRNLKSTRRAAASIMQNPAAELQAVPVLMDAVEVEEERIEHANVFADGDTMGAFANDEFGQDQGFESADGTDPADDEEDQEEDSPMLTTQAAATQTLRDARSLGRDDEDDDYDDEEDDFEEDDEEFEDDEEEDDFDDSIRLPGNLDEDELDDDDDDDDLDDEDDEDEEEDEELEEEEDLDELEGLPEDEWGSEEEQDVLTEDNYENEPVLLQDVYNRAAGHFNRPERQAPRIEPGFGGERFSEEELDEDFSAARNDGSDDLQGAETIRTLPRHPRPAPVPEPAAAPEVASKAVTGRQAQVDLFRDEPRTTFRSAERQQPKEPPPEPAYSGPQEVIIVNVMARPGQYFAGLDLLPLLQQQGLRLGDMSIFHRHADADGSGPVQFSMANMVKPGTFDLTTMDQFVTPGISFFMQMPNKFGNMQCFEQMLKTASTLASSLEGELKDENRSVFTRQTVEHCRQRVRDFELLLLSKKF